MRKKFYFFLSLILWAQLVFTISLAAWRYYLILIEEGDVYPARISPGFEDMVLLVQELCPLEENVGYIGYNEYTTIGYSYYQLYPWRVMMLDMEQLSSAFTVDLFEQLRQEHQLSCLLVDGWSAPEPADLPGVTVYAEGVWLLILVD